MSISSNNSATSSLTDMHCHLDFAPGALQIAREADWQMLTMTADPRDYQKTCRSFVDFDGIRVAAGLHPWWIADGTCSMEEVDFLCRLATHTRFIGEIGLDFSKRHHGSENAQLAAFERIVGTCAREGGKVLSIHALHSADAILDILERHAVMESCTCIMHWFSGSAPQLARAIRMGCMFSLNNRMMTTGRGREYAKAIPEKRILLETDLPSHKGDTCPTHSMAEALQQALFAIEQVRNCPLHDIIADNAHRVLSEKP